MGSGEIMLILAVVLLLFGGKKLPELARGLGKGLRDFKDASEGVKREIHRNINSVGITDEINDFKSAINDDDNSRHHPYDYKSEGQTATEDSHQQALENSDELAAINTGASVTAETVDQVQNVEQADHNKNTNIETDKKL